MTFLLLASVCAAALEEWTPWCGKPRSVEQPDQVCPYPEYIVRLHITHEVPPGFSALHVVSLVQAECSGGTILYSIESILDPRPSYLVILTASTWLNRTNATNGTSGAHGQLGFAPHDLPMRCADLVDNLAGVGGTGGSVVQSNITNNNLTLHGFRAFYDNATNNSAWISYPGLFAISLIFFDVPRPSLAPTAMPTPPSAPTVLPVGPVIPPGEGVEVIIVLTAVGNSTNPPLALLDSTTLAQLLSSLFTRLNISTLPNSANMNTETTTHETTTTTTVRVVLTVGDATKIASGNTQTYDLGRGVTVTAIIVEWPSVITIFNSLALYQFLLLICLVVVLLLIIIIVHLCRHDLRHIPPFLLFVMSLFSFALNVWLLATLRYASSVDPQRYRGFFVAFLIALLAPPIANLISLRVYLPHVLRQDSDFNKWMHTRRLAPVVAHVLAIWGVGNVTLLGSSVWGSHVSVPMKPTTAAHFSAMGVLGTVLELLRVIVQVALAVMFREATIMVALPIATSSLVTLLGILSRVYAVGYVKKNTELMELGVLDTSSHSNSTIGGSPYINPPQNPNDTLNQGSSEKSPKNDNSHNNNPDTDHSVHSVNNNDGNNTYTYNDTVESEII